ncbi:LacI family DNA-binding transcriptional regulator [Panacibacter ginsenosidivorans]|uniref:LacI family DNA-binding transcriptional regulator n=1 Tax=Panacibacter ginsenosidivorans TaxID=1813871 RepID=UPI001CEF77AD|nr:LacI family DNA-binding transcriptional regulator [Panacibacter ginsenosidivorans]
MHTIAQSLSHRITIHDIARELNLTTATVSRALNDHPRISTETKRLVQEKARQMKYRRNKLASSLRSGKSHTIGVIIPSAQMNFFGSVVHGIENVASNNGYSIILYQSEETSALEKKAIETFLSARVDGILASIAKETVDFTHYVELKKRNIPLVFFDRTNEDLKVPAVVVDDYKGAYLATEHLLKNGYKRIAHVAGPQHIKGFRDRLNGYKDALKANQKKAEKNYIYQGNVSIESGKEAVDYFLKLVEPPDAFFAVEDYTALGVIKCLKERKFKIPDEFGVIGFANESFDEHITPALSSVDQQTVQMGKEAFNLLMEMIKINDSKSTVKEKEKIVLEPILCYRESSAGKKA